VRGDAARGARSYNDRVINLLALRHVVDNFLSEFCGSAKRIYHPSPKGAKRRIHHLAPSRNQVETTALDRRLQPESNITLWRRAVT
jgi:hypothetical protein